MSKTLWPTRVGRFSVSEEVLLQSPEALRAVLADVIVVRCEFMFVTRTLEYQAIGDCFEEVPTGEHPPVYEIEYDGAIVTWVKSGQGT